jgi:hypothetical protein
MAFLSSGWPAETQENPNQMVQPKPENHHILITGQSLFSRTILQDLVLNEYMVVVTIRLA